MPDHGGEREDTGRDAGQDAGDGAASVLFEVEVVFEGVEDRLDGLPKRLEGLLAGSGLLAVAGRRTDVVDPGLLQTGLELVAVVVLVAECGLRGI